MRQDPTIIMTPDDAQLQDVCVVCGHTCHCGEVCREKDCHCGVCYHEVEEVDDYINLDDNG